MSRKRILIIENSIHVTGALKSIARMSCDLKEYFDFVFVLPAGSKGRAYLESERFSTIYELPMQEIRRSFSVALLYLPSLLVNSIGLKRIIRKEKIDLVHNNDLYNMLPVAMRLMGVRLPYITHIRFLPDKFPVKLFSGWLNMHLKYASSLICVSEFQKNQIPSHGKIKVIHDVIPKEERYEYTNNRENKLLYLSNIIKGKGQDHAIEAFSKLTFSFPLWKLRFVGGDMGLDKNKRFKQDLISACETKGITDKVEWIDFTQDVEAEYKKAAIVLNFSESESFSLTCAEAQFYGCPVIATQSGGPAEIIIHDQTGFLVPQGDINTMVLAMEALMRDSTRRKDFAEKGREVVREKFSSANTSYRLMSLYNEALA